ncbi:MAG TPA: hypothetical protein DCX07_06695 [Phycisphaerales bacterium]|nr:hypothetical protein [Phycisphaerales bacterium]
MTTQQLLISGILAATVAMFLWGRWRHDMVAAGALLACARLLDDGRLSEMSGESLGDWLRRAWRPAARRYAGRTRVRTGEHDGGPKTTLYQPGTWSDPWDALFPNHDYPLQTAEACLDAWNLRREPVFAEACERWAAVLAETTPAANGRGAYAESYGRAIHFLRRAGATLEKPALLTQARALADEALAVLARDGRLASHPWESRVEAVDGMGWLILALLAMESGQEPDAGGMFW